MINLEYVENISLTGSSYICNPPVTNTDIDYVVFVKFSNWCMFCDFMDKTGWIIGGSRIEHTDSANGFNSFKKNNFNVIATSDSNFYNKFCDATQLAKRLNLLVKSDRVSLFQAILYNNYPVDI